MYGIMGAYGSKYATAHTIPSPICFMTWVARVLVAAVSRFVGGDGVELAGAPGCDIGGVVDGWNGFQTDGDAPCY
jgi:hypothetical protein